MAGVSVDPVVELRVIEATDALHEAELDLRFRVLRAPLGMGRETVALSNEAQCLHLVAVVDQRVVGCVLSSADSAELGRLRQMAVDPTLQGQGVGARLVRRLEDEVRIRGFSTLTLHARWPAIGFYEKLGYACQGDPFTEVGIRHRAMSKRLIST